MTFRFRTNAEPRVEITSAQISERVVPFLFPRGTTDVVVLGSTVTRIDDEKEADRGHPDDRPDEPAR